MLAANYFDPHYIHAVPAEFYHGLNLLKWDGGTKAKEINRDRCDEPYTVSAWKGWIS